MSEKKIKVEAAGMKWSVTVEGFSDGSFSMYAQSDDHLPYHFYYYEIEWDGSEEPTVKEIAECLDFRVEKDAEDAWESSLERYYSV
jgi:hypothetical protein